MAHEHRLAGDATEKQRFRRQLVRWYQRHARELPWRQTTDPYAIWVSEIMLQQTQVATVIPYYLAFMARFPDVRTLARARLQTVLRFWEGLGYYRRARQLHGAARIVDRQFDGTFPDDLADVVKLPGIGRYTAGAILSLALDQRLPILEANTIRLLSRVMALEADPTTAESQRQLWGMAESLLPARNAGRFNQALMELGSQICRPKTPFCDQCPVADHCGAYRTGQQSLLPRKSASSTAEQVTEAAVVIRRHRHVLLRQCQSEERWPGLWDFPRFRIGAVHANRRTDELAGYVRQWLGTKVRIGQELTRLRHSVTRFDITLYCYFATLPSGRLRIPPHSRWVGPREVAQFPLNVTARRLSRLLLDNGRE